MQCYKNFYCVGKHLNLIETGYLVKSGKAECKFSWSALYFWLSSDICVQHLDMFIYRIKIRQDEYLRKEF